MRKIVFLGTLYRLLKITRKTNYRRLVKNIQQAIKQTKIKQIIFRFTT